MRNRGRVRPPNRTRTRTRTSTRTCARARSRASAAGRSPRRGGPAAIVLLALVAAAGAPPLAAAMAAGDAGPFGDTAAGAGAKAGDAARDGDASAAYLAGGAGEVLAAAGLPGPGAEVAPALARAGLDHETLSEAQGRALRPASLASADWLARASGYSDGQQVAAQQDTATAWATWAAWAEERAGGGLDPDGEAPPGAPGAARGAVPLLLHALPRPAAQAQLWFEGPRIEDLTTDPTGEALSNLHPRLTVEARITSPGGVGTARAVLRNASATLVEPMQPLGGDRWRAAFPGPLHAASQYALWVEATDGVLGAVAAMPGFLGAAWGLGFSASEALPLRPLDRIAPTLALELPASYVQADGVEVRLLARDDVAVTQARTDAGDGAGFGPWGPMQERLRVPLPHDGQRTLRVEVRDAADNRALAEAVVVRDTQAPGVEVGLAEDAGWFAGPVSFGARPGGSLAPADLHVTFNGTDPLLAPAAQGTEFRVATPGETPVRLRARDAAGNVGPEVARAVRVDPYPPALRLEGMPPLQEGWLAAPPELRVVAEDAHSGVRSVEVHVAPAGQAVPEAGVQVDAPAFQVPEGRHVVRAAAEDHVGHQATMEREVRVDASPPRTHLSAEGAAPHYLLRWDAHDDGSGVALARVETRAPGATGWVLLAEGGPRGAVALDLAPGEVREVRALAVDRLGHDEAARKPGPDLVLAAPLAPVLPGEVPGGGAGSGEDASSGSGAAEGDGDGDADAADGSPVPGAADGTDGTAGPEGAGGDAAAPPPRLVAEALADGAYRLHLADEADATYRVTAPGSAGPGEWKVGRAVILRDPGTHLVEARVGDAVLQLLVEVPGPAGQGASVHGPPLPPTGEAAAGDRGAGVAAGHAPRAASGPLEPGAGLLGLPGPGAALVAAALGLLALVLGPRRRRGA